jgi:antitoxin VapB
MHEQEIATKTGRIVELLKQHKKDALLISRNENLAWITAGVLTRRVLIPSDTNVGSVLITAAGGRYYLTTNNEAPRLADEDFPGLGFEAVTWPWHADGQAEAVQRIVKAGSLLSDQPSGPAEVAGLADLRAPLLPEEVERFRIAGKEVAAIVSKVLKTLRPGVSEAQMNAMTASELWSAGIEPTVLLMAVDDRILKYKHAIAHGDTLKHFGMVNLCARKFGLAVSLTRFVHFGPMPQKLVDAFGIAAEVNAALQSASHAGATSNDLFAVAQQAYAKAGFPGEEEHHHQGGPVSYIERDWVAAPGGKQTLGDPQALAWNPSINGGKVEDTTLLLNGKIELLTPTPDLPEVHTKSGTASYVSAGVLTL